MKTKLRGGLFLWTLVFTIFAGSNQSQAQQLEQNFANLLERCRVSIEASTKFNSDGLRRHGVAEAHKRDWDSASSQTAWLDLDSQFYVVVTEWTSWDGQTRNLCDVHLADEDRVLDIDEQGLLLRRFLIIQTQLLGFGTHELAPPAPMPPLINAAFVLKERNPNDCKVITSFVISSDGTFFKAGTGEQIHACKAE